MMTPQEIVAQCEREFGEPNLVSIDVEGADEVVARLFLESGCRPAVYVVETLEFVVSGVGRKKTETTDLFADYGYRLYADTFINSIFVDEQAMVARFNR